MNPHPPTILELSGHIIDSLTLAKVIDKIQSAGFHFQLNDFQIGERKNDISYAQLSVWGSPSGEFDALLSELRHYGALPPEQHLVKTLECTHPGTLPEGAYKRLNPPTEIFFENHWIPVAREGADITIVIEAGTQTASFKAVHDLVIGDLVVCGKTGLRILPTLEEAPRVESTTK